MKAIISFVKSLADTFVMVFELVFGFVEFVIDGVSMVTGFIVNIPEPFIYGVTICLFVSISMLIIKLVGTII